MIKIVAVGLFVLVLTGCKPSSPPPDLIKTQRETFNQASALEGQVQQQAQERAKSVEEQQK